MKRIRFSISGLMGFIAIAAVGLAGLREGTEIWASITFSLTAIVLLMAFANLIFSRGASRAGWVGFTLFGWVYLVFAFSTWSGESPGIPSLPTSWLLTTVHNRIHAQPQYFPNPKSPQQESWGRLGSHARFLLQSLRLDHRLKAPAADLCGDRAAGQIEQ